MWLFFHSCEGENSAGCIPSLLIWTGSCMGAISLAGGGSSLSEPSRCISAWNWFRARFILTVHMLKKGSEILTCSSESLSLSVFLKRWFRPLASFNFSSISEVVESLRPPLAVGFRVPRRRDSIDPCGFRFSSISWNAIRQNFYLTRSKGWGFGGLSDELCLPKILLKAQIILWMLHYLVLYFYFHS